MQHEIETLQPNHFANLFGGIDAEAAIRQAESWNLKSRVCHPLDCPNRAAKSADLARFDASIDDADTDTDEESAAES